ncbi:MAG: hypothetical protein Q9M35_02860 [Rhodothermus sp.]|nr:hypothetical protein [Rhodothermus sp.]
MRCLRLALLFIGMLPVGAQAQPYAHTPPGQTGLGGVIGTPSGLSLKIYSTDRSSFTAYDFLLAYDLDRFFFFSLHGLFEQPLPDSPLNYFFGPGALLGIREHAHSNNEMVLGLSVNLGINFFTERFEVFLQVTPRLHLIPATEGDLGGGIGLRYYFGRQRKTER